MSISTPAARARAISEGIESGNFAPANETHELKWLSIAALNDEHAIHHDRLSRDGGEHVIYCAAYARQIYRNELHYRALLDEANELAKTIGMCEKLAARPRMTLTAAERLLNT